MSQYEAYIRGMCKSFGWRNALRLAVTNAGTPEWFLSVCRDYMPRRPAVKWARIEYSPPGSVESATLTWTS